jgi:glycosyltransferase involved in cell wall biosynthesis
MLTKIEQKRKNRYRYTLEELTPLHKDNNSSTKTTKIYSTLTQTHSLGRIFAFSIIFIFIFFTIAFFTIFPQVFNFTIFNDNFIKPSTKRIYSDKEIRNQILTSGRNYLDKCIKGELINDKALDIQNEPKISVIIPICGKEKVIKSVIRSVQNQNMTDIEIILINDCLSDNTIYIIKELQKNDNRIKLIENGKKFGRNVGTLYSRAIGVLEAKGKYILNLDDDDLFFDSDVFDTVYNEAENNNLDIVSFMNVQGIRYYLNIFHMKDGFDKEFRDNFTVYQPELTYYTMFINDDFENVDSSIWGKLIKTEVYKKALDFLGVERYSLYSVANEDLIGLFAICSVAKSYKFIRKYGLFHYIDEKAPSFKISEEHSIKMDILFSEILLDLSKNEYKKFSVFYLMYSRKKEYFSSNNAKIKFELNRILKKICSCEYISQNIKEALISEFRGFGLDLSFNH